MPEFTDSKGTSWEVSLDGLLLAELKERAGVDIVQEGLYLIEEREDVLTKALLVICKEQIEELKLTPKQFAKLICGDATERAIDAVGGAARLFFRQSKWLEIQSRSTKRKEADETYRELLPMLNLLNRPDMPAPMREAVMAVIGDQIEKATNSQTSKANGSAHVQAATQSNSAGESQGSSALLQEV